MVQKVLTLLQDDMDGSEASETVEFGLDGLTYQIDLSTEHAEEIRALFEPYISTGRKTGGRRNRAKRVTKVDTPVDPAAVRAWATSSNIPVPTRGRIPHAVVAQFRAAGN